MSDAPARENLIGIASLHPDDVLKEVLGALDDISRLLTQSAFDLPSVLTEIVHTTARKMNVKASVIRLVNKETGKLDIKAVHGLSSTYLADSESFDTESRFRQLIQTGGVFQIPDIGLDPDLPFSRASKREGICSLLAVGLTKDDRIVGALSVYTESLHHFSEEEIRILRVIANQAVVAIQLARLHAVQTEKNWFERELALAASIQSRILPERMPELDGFEIAAWWRPWEQVSGDFYDFIDLPEENLGIAIGDVSGKGIPASLLMFTVRMALRAHVEHEYAVSEIMRRVNRALYRDTQSEQFATLFYGILNVPARILTYVNASHDPPLLLRGDSFIRLEEGGLPVGMFAGQRYELEQIRLRSGDLMVFFTDGFTDVTGADDEIYGDERLKRCILKHRDQSPKQIIESLESSVERFIEASDHGDDRTIVVLKVK